MTEQLIAVAVTHDGTIAAHAGRALQWQVYNAADNTAPTLAWTLDLTNSGCLHEWHVQGDGNRHPLHFVDIAIAASAGEGVRRRLQERNTELIQVLVVNRLLLEQADAEEISKNPEVAAYRTGTLPAGLPHEKVPCHTH